MASLPRTKSAEVVVPASPEAVWSVLVDVTRVGEWSHEANGASWTRGDGTSVGDVFRGTNRLRWIRWSRPCTVTVLDEPRTFSYRTDGGPVGDRTEWTFELTPVAGGTSVRETYRILRMPRLTELVVVSLMPTHLDRSAAMAGDLERLGALAAGS